MCECHNCCCRCRCSGPCRPHQPYQYPVYYYSPPVYYPNYASPFPQTFTTSPSAASTTFTADGGKSTNNC